MDVFFNYHMSVWSILSCIVFFCFLFLINLCFMVFYHKSVLFIIFDSFMSYYT